MVGDNQLSGFDVSVTTLQNSEFPPFLYVYASVRLFKTIFPFKRENKVSFEFASVWLSVTHYDDDDGDLVKTNLRTVVKQLFKKIQSFFSPTVFRTPRRTEEKKEKA